MDLESLSNLFIRTAENINYEDDEADKSEPHHSFEKIHSSRQFEHDLQMSLLHS